LTRAGIVATATSTAMTIVGYGDVVVDASETNDPWSSQQSYILAGLKGAIDMVVQKSPNVAIRQAEKRLGNYVYPWHLYGIKTFDDGDAKLVYATENASSWS